MKRILFLSALALLMVCCSPKPKPTTVIFDTDMGNDIDDALALAVMSHYIDEGIIRVPAIGMSKGGDPAAAYTDAVITWYGHGDIPLGVVRDVTSEASRYTSRVLEMRDENNDVLFPGTLSNYSSLPDAHTLYRQVLAQEPDTSVIFVVVGFSTNMARLLESGPDQYSPLTGHELVQKKVKELVMMAGRYNEPIGEYNVITDIPSAQKVFAEWPTPIVVTPFELGVDVRFPSSKLDSIGNGKPNPVAEGYKKYMSPQYDACSWDPTALFYAAGFTDLFGITEPGITVVDSAGLTTLTPCTDGNCRVLTANAAQKAALIDHLSRWVIGTPTK